ncbi:MAG: PASTA domain-containing protein [Gemmatimonadetes bacterium]|nr:PASTA domain-containing protein [Gemmatimonadota bacterium]
MARIFDITPASPAVQADSAGRAENSFTVSNASGRALRVRATIVAQGPAQEKWFAIEGERERDLAAGETDQFNVRVTLPPGTEPGSYSFRLLVASVERPDDEWSESAPVTVELKLREKPRIPWWVYVVGGGVAALVIGLVLWLVLRDTDVAVPRVRGLPIEEAEAVLADADLSSELVGDTITGTGGQAGTVVLQAPDSGEVVERGTAVKLTVEADWVEVPKVRGLPVDSAASVLTAVGLTSEQAGDTVTGSTIGSVVLQAPDSGEIVRRGGVVKLTVEAQWAEVPAVIRLQYLAAAGRVQARNFTLALQSRAVAAPQVGQVVAQTPAAGTKRRTGSTVTLVVGRPTTLSDRLYRGIIEDSIRIRARIPN